MSDMGTTMLVLRLNQMVDDAISNFKSERLAHQQTKDKLESLISFVEEFAPKVLEGWIGDSHAEQRLSDKKRLEELEDAIASVITVSENGAFPALEQAIQNSRERQEENRLRTKVAEFIDRNGGEAMGG